jgi:hypothetical protein
MGGLAVLFLLGLYLVLAVLAIVKVKPVWAKGLVLLAVLLIPTADAVYGRYKLKQMCAAEAGLKVYRVAHGVEGFVNDSVPDESLVKSHGFKFSEGSGYKSKYSRVSLRNGQVFWQENINPQSRYIVKLTNLDSFLGSNLFWAQFYSIEDNTTKELLGKNTQIGFRGGWAERLLALFSDAGGGAVAVCNSSGLNRQQLILSTLKP